VALPATNVTVMEGPVLDGVADHMRDRIVLPTTPNPVDVSEELRRSGADVAVCYLLGGAREATNYYAEAALQAGVAFVNCQPEPIANDEAWRTRFAQAGIPLLGDDVKSQIGTTVLNRALLELLEKRGASVTSAYQLNYGGNTDFLNMRDRLRFASKQTSKLSAIRSATNGSASLELVPPEHIGFLQDRKIAYIHIDGEALLGMKFDIELRLSVEDSPNSAGVVIDAVRAAKAAKDRGIGGVVDSVCSWCFKRPPIQMSEWQAEMAMADFASGRLSGGNGEGKDRNSNDSSTR
jgi:myo-inositol-1-phosphate synthase